MPGTVIDERTDLATLRFEFAHLPGQSTPPALVGAARKICVMWKSNPRMRALIQRRLRPSEPGPGPEGYVHLLHRPFDLPAEDGELNCSVEISTGSLLPKELLSRILGTLIHTLTVLAEHPGRQPEAVFFSKWGT